MSKQGRKTAATGKTYTYENRTSLYWKTVSGKSLKAAAERYCDDKDIKKINDFVNQAIYDKLCREGYIKRGR